MVVDHSLTLVADAAFAAGRDLVALAEAAVRGGATVVQLRGKALSYREFLDLGLRAADRLAGTGVPLIVNDRVDVALACGADGAHLGQEDMPLAEARKVLGPDRIIGISTHSTAQAREAALAGADYIGFGPVFPTATKDAGPLQGVEVLKQVRASVGLPVIAIGGIGAENIGAVLAAGADGAAVISAVLGAPDVTAAATRLVEQIRDHAVRIPTR